MDDDIAMVRRNKSVRWFTVTNENGREYRLRMSSDEYGTVTFHDSGSGRTSPELHGPGAVRGFLLAHALTPKGSRSPEWKKQIPERRAPREAAA